MISLILKIMDFLILKKFHRLTFLINGAFLYPKDPMLQLKLYKMGKKSYPETTRLR